MNPHRWGTIPWPWNPPPNEQERIRAAKRRDAHHTVMLRAFGIGCNNPHPVAGVDCDCELEPHFGECAAVMNGRVVTWAGPDDRTVRRTLNNTVNVILYRARDGEEGRERQRAYGRDYRERNRERIKARDRAGRPRSRRPRSAIEPGDVAYAHYPVSDYVLDVIPSQSDKARDAIRALDRDPPVGSVVAWCVSLRTHRKTLNRMLVECRPGEVVVLAKLARALCYLRDRPDEPLGVVAAATNWCDPYTLSNTMMRVIGVRPGAAREQLDAGGAGLLDLLGRASFSAEPTTDRTSA